MVQDREGYEGQVKIQWRHLYRPAVLALMVLTVLTWSIFRELEYRSETGKSVALSEVFPVKTARAAQSNPGTTAWILNFLQDKYNIHPSLAHPRTAREGGPIREFGGILEVLGTLEGFADDGKIDSQSVVHEDVGLRSAGHFKYSSNTYMHQENRLIYTRRSAYGEPGFSVEEPSHVNGSDRFIFSLAPVLTAGCFDVSSDWERLSQDLGDIEKYRPIRIYILAEDGTILGCPKSDPDKEKGDLNFFNDDFGALSSSPDRPHFLSYGFYFNFLLGDYPDPDSGVMFNFDAAQATGIVIDAGSGGLISTIIVPGFDLYSGMRFVLSVDISLFVDWKNAEIDNETPIVRYVQIPPGEVGNGWDPWAKALESLSEEWAGVSGSEEGQILNTLRFLTSHANEGEKRDSIYYKEVRSRDGKDQSIALYRVSHSYWLLALLPEIGPPPINYMFILILMLLLIAWGLVFAWARRNFSLADFERLGRLINNMQVPLVVYSSEDQNKYGNKAAQRKGIERGQKLEALIPERAREYYRAMQENYLREYGIPLDFKDGEKLTLIRSISIREPVRALRAEKGDRMAIFFPVRSERDLKFYEEEIQGKERSRLAQIFSHGVIHMSKTLSQRLMKQDGDTLNQWVSDYLYRRFKVAEKVLHHWGEDKPVLRQSDYFYEACDFEVHFKNLQNVFRIIREDDSLRAEFRWADSVLTESDPDSEVFIYKLDWGEGYNIHCPIKDGVAFLLEELLVNAVKHGLPGSQPEITLTRSGRVLDFRVTNELTDEALEKVRRGQQEKRTQENSAQTYRGLDLSREMVRLFGWGELRAKADEAGEVFVVSWRAPLSESAEL